MFGIFALLSINWSVSPRTPHSVFFLFPFFSCNTPLRERDSCGERHRDHVDVVTEARTGSLGLLYPFSSTKINTSLPYKHKHTFAHTQTRTHACVREPRQWKHAAQRAGGAVCVLCVTVACWLFCQTTARGEKGEENAVCVCVCERDFTCPLGDCLSCCVSCVCHSTIRQMHAVTPPLPAGMAWLVDECLAGKYLCCDEHFKLLLLF